MEFGMYRKAIAALVAAIVAISPAFGWTHGSGGGNNQLTAKTVIGGFDVNGSSYAFINFAKMLGSEGGGAGWATETNADGYPSGPLNLSYSGSTDMTADAATLLAPSVHWRIKWNGNGGGFYANGLVGNVLTIVSDSKGCFVSQGSGLARFSCTMNGTTDYIEFTNLTGATQIKWAFDQFATVYDGTMSDLRIYRASDQAAMDAGEIFTPEFVSLLKTLNPRYLRMMDWGATNGSIAANFSQRTRTTAFSYLSQQFDPARSAGTASGTNTYTASNPPGYSAGAYQQGETFQVLFTNANTGAATINFGSRGAATLADISGTAVTTAGVIPSGAIATCVYDTWLAQMLCNFGFNGSNNYFGGGLTTGVPIEIQVALANKINANLWYNVPFLYTDTAVSSVAGYVRDNLNASLTSAFEYSNEIWNFLFPQSALATAKGAYLGFPNSSGRQTSGYYGLRVRQIMPLITTAWTSSRTTATLRRILANWEGDAAPVSQSQAYRMNGSDLSTSLGYTNYNSVIGQNYNVGSPTFSRPIDFVDSISYAQYMAGALIGNGNYGNLNAADVAALTTMADTNDLAGVDDDLRYGYFNRKSGVTFSGSTFTLAANGLGNNTVVLFRTTGSLPTGLTANTAYLTTGVTTNTFQVRTFNSNTPISVSGGSGTLSVGQVYGESLLWHQNLYFAAPNNLSFGFEQIAASYDAARPAGFSNVKVEQYEGGYEGTYPPADTGSGQCTAWGISTTYCGPGGKIDVLLTNYKNSSYASQFVQDAFAAFMNVSPGAGSNHSVTPAWFALQGPSVWSLMPGSTLSTPYQSYNGNATYNSH